MFITNTELSASEQDKLEKEYMNLLDEIDCMIKENVIDTAKMEENYVRLDTLEGILWPGENGDSTETPDSPYFNCPNCNRSSWVAHAECGDFIDECTCASQEDLFCTKCGEGFTGNRSAKEHSESDVAKMVDKLMSESKKPQTWSDSSVTVHYKQCKHVHQEVALPDGTVVHCTASKNFYKDDKVKYKADFGLYADQSWVTKNTWRNEIINWPDMSLPVDYKLALAQITDAYNRAKNGENVDIGCIGAHGRTGTILGVMYLLSVDGVADPDEIVKWVRTTYCKEAIETLEQEWWIAATHAHLNNLEMPEKPKKSAPITTGGGLSLSCTAIEHLAQIDLGLGECVLNPTCKYWDMDLKQYGQHKSILGIKIEEARSKESFSEALAKVKEKLATKEQLELDLDKVGNDNKTSD